MEDHKVLPYCIVLQCLASRYLGGGMFDPTYYDETHPYRSPPQILTDVLEIGAPQVSVNVQYLNDYKSLHHT